MKKIISFCLILIPWIINLVFIKDLKLMHLIFDCIISFIILICLKISKKNSDYTLSLILFYLVFQVLHSQLISSYLTMYIIYIIFSVYYAYQTFKIKKIFSIIIAIIIIIDLLVKKI